MEERAYAGIEDFLKLDLRLAKVLSAERIEGSDRLLKLRVSLGDEERILVAGIAQHKPRKIFGVESQGMILALSDGENLSLLVPDRDMKEGVRAS